MKIYIFGVDGFIGKSIFNSLKKNLNIDLITLNKNSCNLLNINDIELSLKDIKENDIIIFTSAITRLIDNSINSHNKNLLMIDNICKILKDKVFSNFIFLSTIDIYGIKKEITPSSIPSPLDYYSMAKLTSEFILKNNINDKLTILRLQGVFGEGDSKKSTINYLVNKAINDKKITLINEGLAKRDFIYIGNLLLIIKDLIINKKIGSYNISINKAISIKNFAKMIQKNLPHKVTIENKTSDNSRDYDVLVKDHDFIKTFHNLNFISTEDSIREYIKKEIEKIKNDNN